MWHPCFRLHDYCEQWLSMYVMLCHSMDFHCKLSSQFHKSRDMCPFPVLSAERVSTESCICARARARARARVRLLTRERIYVCWYTPPLLFVKRWCHEDYTENRHRRNAVRAWNIPLRPMPSVSFRGHFDAIFVTRSSRRKFTCECGDA